MEPIESLTKNLSPRQIASIKEGLSYTWSQCSLLHLFMSHILDIRMDRVNILNLEHRTINLYGYYIHGAMVKRLIEDIRFKRQNSEGILFTMGKNFFRGTTHPIFEITKDDRVAKLISLSCFDDKNHFDNFLSICRLIRDVLSHNYSEKVMLTDYNVKGSTIQNIKKTGNNQLSFKYNGKKFFPSIYSEIGSKIDIIINISVLEEGKSLFDAIPIKNLLFLGELSNNILQKLIDIIESS